MATAAAAGAAWDAWWAEHAGTAAVARRQQVRLAALVDHARRASPYYRRLYRAVPPGVTDPVLLPPVAKPQLMEHFDEWVTHCRRRVASERHIRGHLEYLAGFADRVGLTMPSTDPAG